MGIRLKIRYLDRHRKGARNRFFFRMPKRGHNWGEPIISRAEEAEERLGTKKTKILRFLKNTPAFHRVTQFGGARGQCPQHAPEAAPPIGRPPHLRRNFVVILGKMDKFSLVAG